MTEHFRCVQCDYEWWDIIRPNGQEPCRRCKSLYMKWVNYSERRLFPARFPKVEKMDG